MAELKIGVLALQGAFAKHADMMRSLEVDVILVRTPEDLALCEELIIPGGESTTIFRQLNFIKLVLPLAEFAQKKPVFGTCAGLILMSREIIANEQLQPFGLLDIAVERNAFGRQVESFNAALELALSSRETAKFAALFIRAPRIRQCSTKVTIIASYEGEPVLVQQGIHLGATFHPELTADPLIHQYFLSIVKKNKSGPKGKGQ